MEQGVVGQIDTRLPFLLVASSFSLSQSISRGDNVLSELGRSGVPLVAVEIDGDARRRLVVCA